MRANAANSFQDIGFGYVGNAAQHKPPAVIAYEQTSAAGETSGDLVFGTRGTTSGSTAAVEQVRIRSDGTVDVESVRFTGSQIGINGDPNLMVLTSGVLTVDGKVASTTLETSGAATVGTSLDVGTDLDVGGDMTLSNTAAVQISHSGSGSLSISSGGYVAVESVQFAGDNIGINGDTNLMVLTSGVLTVDGKVASTTLETSGAATVGTSLDVGTDLDVGGDLTLSSNAAVQISHSGSGSLSISSGGYVAVESVQFAGDNIGISGDTNLMVLTSGVLTVDGEVASTTLDVTGATTLDSATVTGAASFGGEFSTAYAAVSASGGTATCTDAKSVCVVTGAGGASDGAWTVTYGGNSPATGTMVFVRNGSGVDTASTAFGTGTQILKNTGALFVYSGSAWTRII